MSAHIINSLETEVNLSGKPQAGGGKTQQGFTTVCIVDGVALISFSHIKYKRKYNSHLVKTIQTSFQETKCLFMAVFTLLLLPWVESSL